MTESSTTEANTVAIKLPTFWSHRPQIWFAQAEAQFERTRFYHVVAALDAVTTERVEDLIVFPPSDNQYKALKKTTHLSVFSF